jgi:hypothetical protein
MYFLNEITAVFSAQQLRTIATVTALLAAVNSTSVSRAKDQAQWQELSLLRFQVYADQDSVMQENSEICFQYSVRNSWSV